MSASTNRSSRGGKSSKTADRKTGRKPAAAPAKKTAASRSPRTAEKPARSKKPAKAAVQPKPKLSTRSTIGPVKKQRVKETEKPKKTPKTAPVVKAEEHPKKPRAKKSTPVEAPVVVAAPLPEPEVKPKETKPRRGRKPAVLPELADEPIIESIGSPRSSAKESGDPDDEGDLVQEYLEDDISLDDEEIVIPDDIELDPIGLPLELLDPDLVDVPRPAAPPKPKPKLPKAERRTQTCSGCGGSYGWVSVEGLCFNCLKKKLAQRKRDDEGFSGFTAEPEDDGED